MIAERMDIAKDEIAQSHLFDYTVISGTREEDLAELLKIIESARGKSRDE